jgi:glycosyltransferase involved in cell wall biosynthesis
VIPHGAPGAWAMATEGALDDDARTTSPSGATLDVPADDVPTVAVLGAVGPDKGARRLERLVELVRSTGAPVRYVLIGYMDVQHGPWQSDDAVLTVHGRYDPRELPRLFAHYRVRLVAYPSAGPETFSFTLSESWAAGCPVIVPPFGALAERLEGTGAGWAWTDEEWRDAARMLARIVALVAPPHAAELAAASDRARQVPQPTLAAMAERTLAHYDAAVAAGAARGAPTPPLEWSRMRAAERAAASPGTAT